MYSKILYNIRKNFVKVVKLKEIEICTEFLILTFKLKRFFPFRKEIKLNVNGEAINNLEIKTENSNIIAIRLPLSYVYKLEEDITLQLYINNKKMWITNGLPKNLHNNIYKMGNKIYSVRVSNKVYFDPVFNNYKINEQNYFFDRAIIKESELYLKVSSESFNPTQKMYAMKKNSVLEINYRYHNGWLILGDITHLTSGFWRLFIREDGPELRFLTSINNINDIKLNTEFHNVRAITDKIGFYLYLSPHEFTPKNIIINKDPLSNSLKIDICISHLKSGSYELIMETVPNGEHQIYKVQLINNKLSAHVPKKHIFKSFSRKRFFLRFQDELNTKVMKFNLTNNIISGKAASFLGIISSQKTYVKFYVRKDKSLGLRMPSPKLNKEIYKIENNELYGYLSNTEMFPGCTFYLIIEERYSKDKIEIRINNRFKIDLKSLALDKIDKKEKTILDFFVVVKDGNGMQVRKEKIKYKYSNYKKDNYYDSFSIEDDFGNKHYYLITTTPFNNLKVEYFIIPNTIKIPEDTSKKDSNVWLIGERSDTAQDNGFVFFKWMLENTSVDVYYVIEKYSDDYKKIKHIPNVLKFGSEKHFEIAFKAKVLLGTHDLENLLPYKTARGFFHYENTIRIFLQHGVLGRKNVEYHKKYYELPFDYFIVSSEPEKYQIVIDQMGYEEEEVLVTGLARFDNLYSNEVYNRDILLMPTWRDWLNTEEGFINSQYFLNYKELLSDKKLLNLLEENNIKINFYPHYRAQSFFQTHLDINEEYIQFIKLGSRSVQDLLKSHKLLITDYSSVSFDFLFMQKPIIYFHFDEKRFFRRGILRPINETFIGEIGHTVEEVVNLIEESISSNYKNNTADISGVIKYVDGNNSRRIYELIQKKLDK